MPVRGGIREGFEFLRGGLKIFGEARAIFGQGATCVEERNAECLAAKIVEVLFFVGLVGCVLVVTISWISIFKEGFSNSDDHASSIR